MTSLSSGARVKAQGLVGASHLNGQVGTVESCVGDRVQVRFDGSVEVKSLKRRNLALVGGGAMDIAKAYWAKAEAMMPTPFGLSKRQVLSIGVALLAVFLAMTLFGGRGQRAPPMHTSPSARSGATRRGGSSSSSSSSSSSAFESTAEYARVQSAYKAGYDAAEGGLGFGANLQPLLNDAKRAMASAASGSSRSNDGFDDEEEDDDDFAMPSPPMRPAIRGGSTMGIIGMIGPIILGKQIFDLGRCPGIPIGSPGFWDWRLCIAQLKNLSGMRKGFMALMVLRMLGMSPI